jgi:putative hydrolase of the HAD superfamily
VIDSHEERVEKPDPEIFRIALERSGSDAETTLHVGDIYHVDVVGARAAGLQAILVDRGDLHEDRDCVRVANLTELADLLDRDLP